MTTMTRWMRFNAVGLLGAAVQLGTLALLNGRWPGHYLAASAVALELTLLHNFLWHWHYTWSDRREGTGRMSTFARFRLSNGMVSMAGNLLLMRLLVHDARLPVLLANVLAGLCCAVVNFALGNRWAFASRPREADCRKPTAASQRRKADCRKPTAKANGKGASWPCFHRTRVST